MGSGKNPAKEIHHPTEKTSFFLKLRGISTIEYAFLVIIVVAAFIGMGIYFKRALSGGWRTKIDESFGKGRQYDPYATQEIEF